MRPFAPNKDAPLPRRNSYKSLPCAVLTLCAYLLPLYTWFQTASNAPLELTDLLIWGALYFVGILLAVAAIMGIARLVATIIELVQSQWDER